jgi:hypothetical protein
VEPNGYTRVISNTPTNEELGVELDTKITVQFSVDMEEDTINKDTFIVMSEDNNYVPGEIIYENQVATFIPNNEFLIDTTYNVTLKGSLLEDADYIIEDVVGNNLPEDYTFQFTTTTEKPLEAPTITSPEHKTIVDVNELEISWTAIYNADNYDVEICDDKRFENIVYATNVTSTSIKPYGLDSTKEYFVRVRAQSQTVAGGDWSKVNAFYLEDKSPTSYEQEETDNTYIEVVNLETTQVSTELSAIEFKIYDQLTDSDLGNIDISLVGKSIHGIPYIESDGDVSGSLEIKKQTDTYILLRYVI